MANPALPTPFERDFSRYDVAIRLTESFRFAHEPVRSGEVRFAGRVSELDELTSRLLFSEGGSFLITGYRGVGKTSFVNQVTFRLKQALPWAEARLGPTELVNIDLSLARPVEPAALMHYIIRRLYDRLRELGIFPLLPGWLQQEIVVAFQRTTFNMVRKDSASTEFTAGKESGIDATPKFVVKFPFEYKSSQVRAQEISYLGYDDRSAEYDIIRLSRAVAAGFEERRGWLTKVSDRLRGTRPRVRRLKIVFVFDELDKLDDAAEGGSRRYVDFILNSLKTLFTTSGISFVFVAGKDLHERWLEEVGQGDSVYESVFSYDRYLSCLWNDARPLCEALIDERVFDQPVCEFCRQSWRRGDLLCGRCGKYLKDRDSAREAYEDFLKYLGFRGRGIPRRIVRTFHQLVRWYDHWPVLAFTSEDRRVHRLFAELFDLLYRNEGRLYPDAPEESPGARRDRLRLAEYYLIDWIFQQGKNDFAAPELIASAERLSNRIAPGARLSDYVVHQLIAVLMEGGFLEEVRPAEEQVKIEGAAPAPVVKRYRVPARRLHALGGKAELLPEDVPILKPEGDLGRYGAYRLLRRLATGGMAMIYLASDELRGRTAVVKVMLPELAFDEWMTQRFRNEAEILGSMRHPNIVQYFDSGEEGGRLYIAMEYIDGVDLAAVLKTQKRVPIDAALAIAVRVADALDYVHNRGFVRNDVTPRNIMLSNDARVRILDFGISKRLDGPAEVEHTRVQAGTPLYMAPEQFIRGEADARSDMYALGVVLYEMVTGRRPFEASGIEALELAVRNSVPLEPLNVAPELDPALNALIVRLMAKEPSERYADMREVRDALQAIPGDWLPSAISDLVATSVKRAGAADVRTAVGFAPLPERPPANSAEIGEFTRLFASPAAAEAPAAAPSVMPPPPPAPPPATPPAFVPPAAAAAGVTQYPQPAMLPMDQTVPGTVPAIQIADRHAVLRLEEGPPMSRREFPLGMRTTIGRSPENDIALESASVSRFQTQISYQDGSYVIEDLNSANGTFVDDVAVRGTAVLRSGSRIRVGVYLFVFDEVIASQRARLH